MTTDTTQLAAAAERAGAVAARAAEALAEARAREWQVIEARQVAYRERVVADYRDVAQAAQAAIDEAWAAFVDGLITDFPNAASRYLAWRRALAEAETAWTEHDDARSHLGRAPSGLPRPGGNSVLPFHEALDEAMRAAVASVQEASRAAYDDRLAAVEGAA